MFFQFINEAPENMYERHMLGNDFNLSPEEPRLASDFMTSDSSVSVVKMCFGQSMDPNHPDILSFPHNWGFHNREILTTQWIDPNVLTASNRAELMMNPTNFGDQLDEAASVPSA